VPTEALRPCFHYAGISHPATRKPEAARSSEEEAHRPAAAEAVARKPAGAEEEALSRRGPRQRLRRRQLPPQPPRPGRSRWYRRNTTDRGASCSPSKAALRRIRSRVWTARGKARKARNKHERTDHFHHYLPLASMAVVGRARPGSRVDHKPARCAH
jgi:hypothetical protein